ncbi:hypothetical protein [uncultured Acetobacterium sp.]|uniref:hypothetical protein n=1 Tax=uncultured Acetobacterium sp. TaxID=217139 RepID=UPI0025D9B95D|nr:hypothetical protein [uncultured Acetobacterium sp.]
MSDAIIIMTSAVKAAATDADSYDVAVRHKRTVPLIAQKNRPLDCPLDRQILPALLVEILSF